MLRVTPISYDSESTAVFADHANEALPISNQSQTSCVNEGSQTIRCCQ
jgi:hypothetical protein